MHIIVGGCGRLGAEIATRLSVEGEDVVVVDIDPLAFDRLGSAFNGETIAGDITDRDVLEKAGVAHADGLLACTRFDNANLMAVEIATHLYGVGRSVARLFNPERERSYQKLGVRYVSATAMLAKQFLNEFREDTLRLHLAFPFGDVEVVETRIARAGHGKTVADVQIRGRLRICAIRRGDRIFIPGRDDRLEEGDLVVAATRRGVRQRIEYLIDDAREPERSAITGEAD